MLFSASALLSVRKLPSIGMISPRLVEEGSLYVIRNKRRRIAVTLAEVDPDAEARQQQQQQQQQQAKGGSQNPAAEGKAAAEKGAAARGMDF